MTVFKIEHYNQIPFQDQPEVAKNLKAIAKGHTFKYESVVGDKTYVFKENVAKKILQRETTEQPRTLEQLHAEAKPEGHPRLSKLAQEQLAHPHQEQSSIHEKALSLKEDSEAFLRGVQGLDPNDNPQSLLSKAGIIMKEVTRMSSQIAAEMEVAITTHQDGAYEDLAIASKNIEAGVMVAQEAFRAALEAQLAQAANEEVEATQPKLTEKEEARARENQIFQELSSRVEARQGTIPEKSREVEDLKQKSDALLKRAKALDPNDDLQSVIDEAKMIVKDAKRMKEQIAAEIKDAVATNQTGAIEDLGALRKNIDRGVKATREVVRTAKEAEKARKAPEDVDLLRQLREFTEPPPSSPPTSV